VIALFAALWNEISDLVGAAFTSRGVSQAGLRAWQGEIAGQEVLLVQTGMGKERAESAAGFILENYPVRTALSFGFGGALAPHLAIADLVLCRDLHCAVDASSGQVYAADRDLIDLAAEVAGRQGLRWLAGRGLTVDHLAGSPSEKRLLGSRFAAQVVDMESYWIARLAAGRCRFLALRAVSDTLDESLPPFDRFVGPGGEWRWRPAAAGLLSRPALLARLPAIGFHAFQARRSLARFVTAFLGDLTGLKDL